MKNVTDMELKKTVADSIGLDEDRQREILDVIHVVNVGEDTITLETSDRATFELIISGAFGSNAFWPAQQSIAASAKQHVENDAEHIETSDKWLQRGTTMIINNQTTSAPPHTQTHEDWLGKGTTLASVERLTSTPRQTMPRSGLLRHTRSSIVLNGGVTDVPAHIDTSSEWLAHTASIILTPPSINAPSAGELVQQNENTAPGMGFSNTAQDDPDQRDAWLPSSASGNDQGEQFSSDVAKVMTDRFDETQLFDPTDSSDASPAYVAAGHHSPGGENASPKNEDREFQTVRTSLPPPYRRSQRARQIVIATLLAAVIVLASLITVLIAMRQNAFGSDDSPVVSAVMIQPTPDAETVVAPVEGQVVSGVRNAAPVEMTSATVSGKKQGGETSRMARVSGRSARKSEKQDAVPADRTAINAAMKAIESSIQSCRLDKRGKLRIRFDVARDGKLLYTETVDDLFSGTTTGYCASSAAREIHLPPSGKGNYTLYHTFNL